MYSFTVIGTLFLLSCSMSTSFTVMLYFILKKQLARRSSRLMFCMALSDLIGASFWFADIINSICPMTMIINLYGYQAAQTWSSIIGIYLILKFSGKRIPPEYIFHLIAWSIPFIPQIVILSQGLYKNHPPPQGCWVEFGYLEMVVITIPQLVCILLNALFLGIICIRRKGYPDRWRFKNSDASLYLVLICCLITSVASILQSIPNAPTAVYEISYFFGAAQGLLNTFSMRQSTVIRFVRFISVKLFNIKPPPRMVIPVPVDATVRDFSTACFVVPNINEGGGHPLGHNDNDDDDDDFDDDNSRFRIAVASYEPPLPQTSLFSSSKPIYSPLSSRDTK